MMSVYEVAKLLPDLDAAVEGDLYRELKYKALFRTDDSEYESSTSRVAELTSSH